MALAVPSIPTRGSRVFAPRDQNQNWESAYTFTLSFEDLYKIYRSSQYARCSGRNEGVENYPNEVKNEKAIPEDTGKKDVLENVSTNELEDINTFKSEDKNSIDADTEDERTKLETMRANAPLSEKIKIIMNEARRIKDSVSSRKVDEKFDNEQYFTAKQKFEDLDLIRYDVDIYSNVELEFDAIHDEVMNERDKLRSKAEKDCKDNEDKYCTFFEVNHFKDQLDFQGTTDLNEGCCRRCPERFSPSPEDSRDISFS